MFTHFFTLLLTWSLVTLGLTTSVWARPQIQQAQKIAQVKSFKEWKSAKIVESEGRVREIKIKMDSKKDPNISKINTLEAGSAMLKKMESDLKRELLAVEIAKDLTVSDYFVGYLARLEGRENAFKEVASKLSSEEVVELMSAYANSVFDASEPLFKSKPQLGFAQENTK